MHDYSHYTDTLNDSLWSTCSLSIREQFNYNGEE